MSKPTIAQLRETVASGALADLSPNAFKVWTCYAAHANQRGEAWPSRAAIAHAIGTSEKTVTRARKSLTELGLLQKLPGLEGEQGNHKFAVVWFKTRRDTQDVPPADGPGGTPRESRQHGTRRDTQDVPPAKVQAGQIGGAGGTNSTTRRDTQGVPLSREAEKQPTKQAAGGMSPVEEKLKTLQVAESTRKALLTKRPGLTERDVAAAWSEVQRGGESVASPAGLLVTKLRNGAGAPKPKFSIDNLSAEERDRLHAAAVKSNPSLKGMPRSTDDVRRAMRRVYDERQGVA